MLPDTLSWVLYGFHRLFKTGTVGVPVLAEIPAWTFTLYNISHSIIVALTGILVIFIWRRRVPIYIFAWPIAIVMDALTHTRSFLPTPFLWPIFDWTFPGISWANRTVMTINYILIVLSLCVIMLLKKRKAISSSQ